MDPPSARLEPLLSTRFANARPVSVPYPLGDGKSNTLVNFVQNNPQLFREPTSSPPQPKAEDNNGMSKRRQSDGSLFYGSEATQQERSIVIPPPLSGVPVPDCPPHSPHSLRDARGKRCISSLPSSSRTGAPFIRRYYGRENQEIIFFLYYRK